MEERIPREVAVVPTGRARFVDILLKKVEHGYEIPQGDEIGFNRISQS
jgi:hypothetical protein